MASSRTGIKSKPLSIMWKAEYNNQIQVRMLQITQIHISVLFFQKVLRDFHCMRHPINIYIYIYIYIYICIYIDTQHTHINVPFNLSSCNLNSVIIQHIKTVVWILLTPPAQRKSERFHQWNRQISGTVFRKATKIFGLHQSQKRMVMTLNKQVKEIPKWNTSLNSCAVQVKGH